MPRNFKLYRFEKKNIPPKDIVIFTIPSAVKRKNPLLQSVLQGSSDFHHTAIEKYFRRELHMDKLPYHYALEYINSDYYGLTIEPVFTRSSFLEQLIKDEMIPYQYMNAIAVCVYEDFAIDHPDMRFYETLAYRILTPLMVQHCIMKERVKFLDEILIKEPEESEGFYVVKRSPFFVATDLALKLVKFLP